jgi:hypothetical protein
MTTAPSEGGCLCGAIRYRASGEPRAKAICHCRTCRLATGAPSVAWVVWRASDFAFTRGQPTRFASSPGIERTFCGQCGTPLTYQRIAEPATIDVTTVTLDAANDFAPTKEIWTDHKLLWEPVNEAIPQFPGSSVKRPQST